MKRGTSFVYLFRHFNLTPVRNLISTSALQLAPVLLHLPVWCCMGFNIKEVFGNKNLTSLALDPDTSIQVFEKKAQDPNIKMMYRTACIGSSAT